MSDEIRKIAALIGHQQAQEKRVAMLIDEFQKESVLLSRKTERLATIIDGLGTSSGKMTETVRQSVYQAMREVKSDLKQTGIEHQKPAVNALNQVVEAAEQSVQVMRRDMSLYTWKSAIYLVLTLFFVLASCVAALTWFMNDGYSQIAQMQRMEAVWQKKAPLADIRLCDEKPCISVDTDKTYGDENATYFIIK